MELQVYLTFSQKQKSCQVSKTRSHGHLPDERKKISFVAFAVREKPCAIQSETKLVKAGQ